MAGKVKFTDDDPEAMAKEVDGLIARTNLPRIEATAAVLRSHGLYVSDLDPTRPLTEEERRLGVNRSLLDDLSRAGIAEPTRAAA